MTETEKKELPKETKEMVESTKYMLDDLIEAVDQDIKVVKMVASKYTTLHEMNAAMIQRMQTQYDIDSDDSILGFVQEETAEYMLISKMLAEAGVFLCDLKDMCEKERRELDDFEIIG